MSDFELFRLHNIPIKISCLNYLEYLWGVNRIMNILFLICTACDFFILAICSDRVVIDEALLTRHVIIRQLTGRLLNNDVLL